ncbi:MAG: iron-sulfur cluster assembly scaffold protein [Pseudomonadota bacterium]
MSADQDLIKLYSNRILALAADIPHLGRLDHPDVTVKRRAPLCGSTVTIDLKMANGQVTDYAAEVKACALGQAAASVVGRNVIGRTEQDLLSARAALRRMLKNDGPTPAAPFEELDVLRAAKDFNNRHDSILLTLDALAQAFDDIRASA